MKRFVATIVLFLFAFFGAIECSAEASFDISAPESFALGRSFKASVSVYSDEPLCAVYLELDCNGKALFKKADPLQKCSIYVNDKSDITQIAVLSDDVFENGEIVELTISVPRSADEEILEFKVKGTAVLAETFEEIEIAGSVTSLSAVSKSSSSTKENIADEEEAGETTHIASSKKASSISERASSERSVSSKSSSSKRSSSKRSSSKASSSKGKDDHSDSQSKSEADAPELEESYVSAAYPDPKLNLNRNGLDTKYITAAVIATSYIFCLFAAFYTLGQNSMKKAVEKKKTESDEDFDENDF